MHGVEVWKEAFKEYSDYYTIIGGAACFLNMEEVGLDFRATKDFDTVLIIEKLDERFVKRFWEFIQDGNYQSISKNDKYYRFEKPTNEKYPKMIELFSRKLSQYKLLPETHLTPIHISDSISSLSAILLDDNYYEFLLSGRKNINGIVVLDEEHLIVFKAKAYLENLDRQKNGEKGLTSTIKKHKNDIARLLTVLPRTRKVELNEALKRDMKEFINRILEEHPDDFKIIDLTTKEYCELLSNIYLGTPVEQ